MSKGDKLYHNYICAAVLNDPSTSQFSKDIIQAALKRDPVDVANELEALANLFSDRFDDQVDRLLEEGKDRADLAVQANDDK
jgi:hypothetical protein